MIIPVRFHILTVLCFLQIISAQGQSASNADASCENQIRVINQSSCQHAVYLKSFSSDVSEEFLGLLEPGQERMITSEEKNVFVYAVNDLNQQVASVLSLGCKVKDLAIASCFVDQQSDNSTICQTFNLGIKKNNKQIVAAQDQEILSCGDQLSLHIPDAEGIAVWTNTFGYSNITFDNHNFEISQSIDEYYKGEYIVDWYDANGCSIQRVINLDVANCCLLRNEMIADSVLCDGDSILLVPKISENNICSKELTGYANDLFASRGNVEDLDNFVGAPDSYGPSLSGYATNEQTFVILQLDQPVPANTEICVYVRLGQCDDGNTSDFKISAGIRSFSLDDEKTFQNEELSTEYKSYCLTTSQPAEFVRLDDLGSHCGIRFDAIEWRSQVFFDDFMYMWSTGSKASSIMVDEPGLYTLQMIDCNGCSTYNEVFIGMRNCEIVIPDPEPCDEAYNPPSTLPDDYMFCYGESRFDGNVSQNDFDLDSYSLTWEIEQSPDHGIVTLQKDGTFFYYPDSGYSGEDKFSYTACKEEFSPCSDENLIYKCAVGSVSLNIHLPEFDLGSDLINICSDEVSILSVPETYNAQWSTGQTDNTIAVNSAGTYRVTITDNLGCQNTDEVTLNVEAIPSIIISKSNDLNCEFDSAIITATGGEKYEWNTGQTGERISVIRPGEYIVTVTNANGCSKVNQISVAENVADITTVISGPRTICSEDDVVVLSAFGGDSYRWSTGQVGQSIQVTGTGSYTVTATNNISRCESEAFATISLTNVFADAGPDITSCSGESVIIGADRIGSPNATFTWDNGASGIVNSNSSGKIVVAPTSTQTYNLTITTNTCVMQDQVTVFVNEFDFTTTGNITICPGSSTTISASGATQFRWNTGEISADITVAPSETTTYSVIGSDENGCDREKIITVFIEEPISSTISDDQVICPGATISLNATGGSVYQWSNGAIGSAITVSPDFSTNYVVTITNNQGCSTTESVNVEIENILAVNLGADKVVCGSNFTELIAPPADSYLWSTGETTQVISVSPDNTQTFSVTVTKGKCSAFDDIVLEVRDCLGDISGYALTDTGDPISGISIFLFNESNNLQDSKLTAANGYYQFSSIPSGNYKLQQSEITGYFNHSDVDESPDDNNDVDGVNNIINVALEINESDADNNFRDIKDSGTITGYALTDLNEPISGVTIYLYDNSGRLVNSIVTSVDGYYQFNDVFSGSYIVQQSDIPGFINISDQDESPDDDNDVDGVNNSINVIVTFNEIDADNNFRDARERGMITGFALSNTNEPIADVFIYLFNLSGDLIDFKATNAAGYFQFSSIASGDYILEQTPIEGYTNFSDQDESPDDTNDVDGTNDKINVFLDVNEIDADNIFRDAKNSGSISGSALLDIDNDGRGDRPFLAENIYLRDVNNILIQTTIIDENGQYSFTGLIVGEYFVEQDAVTGYENVFDTDVITDSQDTDGLNDPVDNRIYVRLTEDEIDTGNDFLDRENVTGISGYVLLDTNGDGIPDEGQANIAIDLLNRFGARQSRTTTSETGYYEFIDIPTGEYYVGEDQANDSEYISLYDRDESVGALDPDGYDESADDIISVILESGEHDSDNNFINIIPNYGQIGGFVYEDQNGDDIGDVGMGGIQITLYDLNNNSIARVQTEGTGRFLFEDVTPGDYYLVETDVVGYEDVSDFDTDSDDPNDVDGANDVIYVTVNPNEIDDGNTFVNRRTEGAIVENCEVFKSDDFVTGTSGFWILGGSNAEIEINQGVQGLPSIGFVDLNNNNGIESSIYSTPQNFSILNSLIVKFQFYVRGADPDDYYVFEVSKDGGNNFKEVKRWLTNIDFDNGTWNNASVTVPKEDLSETTILRFRSELSSPNEHLYLDEIIVEGCFDETEDNGSGTAFTVDKDQTSLARIAEKQSISNTEISFSLERTSHNNSLEKIGKSQVHPNPASDKIHINLANVNINESVSIEIYAMDGSLQLRTESQQKSRISLDISALKSDKLYLIYLRRDNKLSEMFRFLKIN